MDERVFHTSGCVHDAEMSIFPHGIERVIVMCFYFIKSGVVEYERQEVVWMHLSLMCVH